MVFLFLANLQFIYYSIKKGIEIEEINEVSVFKLDNNIWVT